jgi:hypothetical protein
MPLQASHCSRIFGTNVPIDSGSTVPSEEACRYGRQASNHFPLETYWTGMGPATTPQTAITTRSSLLGASVAALLPPQPCRPPRPWFQPPCSSSGPTSRQQQQ